MGLINCVGIAVLTQSKTSKLVKGFESVCVIAFEGIQAILAPSLAYYKLFFDQ